ncbi:hypothetical protein SAMN05444920_101691 [Nonomuraea solani]|uniref:Uncharacterized protein n=1 Tax=Nonomuraea solani TaxID=1144553 RepID=A0A1H5UXH9_9ACTN|nr:hypothetical protein [Nonomuraea solani]SEF79779.1 hypothetical protein SAMN05444920_101691 [Nonomuraea solani]
MSRLLSLLTATLMMTSFATPAAAETGTAYYVDANGDDSASGLDAAHAWKSLAKVSGTTFQPGDRILLRAGQRWSGQQLWPKGSGESGAPITIDLDARYDITNNLLRSTRAGAVLTTSPTITYDHNLYGGASLAVPPGDRNAVVTADPLFAKAPLDGPNGTPETGPALEAAYGPRITSGSYAIDAGTEITGNGGRDYAGTPLYNGAPDIGAFEYTTPQDATTESVTGTALTPRTPCPQRAVVPVTGRKNGVYVYTGELINQAGRTATTSVKVTVTDAKPGTPALSGDNRDGGHTVAEPANAAGVTRGRPLTVVTK